MFVRGLLICFLLLVVFSPPSYAEDFANSAGMEFVRIPGGSFSVT